MATRERLMATAAVVWFGLCVSDARSQDAPNPDAAIEAELARLRKLEAELEPPTADEERRDRNQAVLDAAKQLPSSDEKSSLLRRATRVFVKHNDFEDARSAAQAHDPNAFERAKSLVVIAEAERLTGQSNSAWWSLHEASEIALKLPDQQQVLTVFRQIGEVEAKLANPGASRLDSTSDDVVRATLNFGIPKPGYEEVEILRTGGGPLREPQVIRHVYFYSGDRKFQGPALSGGPTIVRATHPRTGCVCDICLTLPRGAPTIEYSDDQIDYVYPDVEVHLHFHRVGDWSVRYCQFDAKLHRWVRHLVPERDESGFWFFGGESNVVRNAASIAAGPVLNVGSRLPVTSGLIRPEEKRVRNTLANPKQPSHLELLRRSSLR